MAVVRNQLSSKKPPGSRLSFSRRRVQHFVGSSTIELPSILAESGCYSPSSTCSNTVAPAAAPIRLSAPEGHRAALGETVQTQPSCHRVSTNRLRRAYRANWWHFSRVENPVRLAVDGLALVYHVMGEPGEHQLCLELGCDYLSLFGALKDYLEALTGAGIVPFVIVDGMQDKRKEATTLDRRRKQAVEACAIMNRIGAEQVTAPGNPGHRKTPSLLPLFAVETLVEACRSTGVSIRAALREADPELAVACRPLPADHEHASRDSQTPPGEGRRGSEEECCLERSCHSGSALVESGKNPSNKPSSLGRPGGVDGCVPAGGTEAEGPESKPSIWCRSGKPDCGVPADGAGASGDGRPISRVDVNNGGPENPSTAGSPCTRQLSKGGDGGISHRILSCTPRGGIYGDGSDSGHGLGCAAVLSSDSDFIVMDVPGYIPLWSLAVGDNGSAGALIFRRPLLAARLGIPADRMPDLACLLGNDWIQPNASVQRTIADEARSVSRDSGGKQKKKQRKGAVRTPRSGNHSAALSAKELVEVTARFLSWFYRSSGSLREIPPHSAAQRLGYAGNSSDDSATLLCSHFFPALREAPPLIPPPVETPETCGRRSDCPFRDRSAGKLETVPPEEISAGLNSRSVSISSVAAAVENDTLCAEPSGECQTLAGGWTKAPPKSNASRRARGDKERRKGGRTSGEGGRKNLGQAPRLLDSPAMALKGQSPTVSSMGGTELGQDFLRDFKAARLHYVVHDDGPPIIAPSADRDLPPSATLGRRFASHLGLRAGTSVPPGVAQAVLEGVFWCRVLLEDIPIPDDPPRSESPSAKPSPSTIPRASSAFGEALSCAFGRMEGVRKRIYELCLRAVVEKAEPLLLGGCSGFATVKRSSPEAPSTQREAGTSTRGGQGRVENLDRAEREDPAVHRRGGSFFGDVGERGRAKGGSQSQTFGLKVGDEWVVTEFRRVRESIRVFRVSCRVPQVIPPEGSACRTGSDVRCWGSRRSNAGAWETCLSVLGLDKEGNNRLVEAILAWSQLSRERATELGGDDAGPISNGSTSPALIGIALVAALLLSIESSKEQRSSSFDVCPLGRGSKCNGSWCVYRGSKCRGLWCSGVDGGSGRACLETDDAVLAFVVTTTRCIHHMIHPPDKPNPKLSNVNIAEGDCGAGVPTPGKWDCYDEGSCVCGRAGGFDFGDEVDASVARKHDHPVEVGLDFDPDFHAPSATKPKPRYENDHKYVASRGVSRGEAHDKHRGDRRAGCDKWHAQAFRESFSLADDAELNEGVGVDVVDEVRAFVSLWSRVQSAVWHVNTCLEVLGLAGAVRGSEALSCTAVHPLRLRPALALEAFRKRIENRRRHSLLVAGRQKRRYRPVDVRFPSVRGLQRIEDPEALQTDTGSGNESELSQYSSEDNPRTSRESRQGKASVTNRGSRRQRTGGEKLQHCHRSRFREKSGSNAASFGGRRCAGNPREGCCCCCCYCCWSGWVVETCQGDYKWALRVRAVLEAIAAPEYV